MKRFLTVLLGLALLAGAGFWWFLPSHVLKRRTEALLNTMTLEIGDGKSQRHLGAYSLNGLLEPEVTLESAEQTEANGVFPREELESVYSWMCDNAKQSRFEVGEFRQITIVGDRATVELSVQGMVELQVYRPLDGLHQATLHWVKSKDVWRLERAIWKPSR